jgi:hypothetical protein
MGDDLYLSNLHQAFTVNSKSTSIQDKEAILGTTYYRRNVNNEAETPTSTTHVPQLPPPPQFIIDPHSP